MKKITKLWDTLATGLVDLSSDDKFIDQVYDKFDEVFDIKEVTEYKNLSDLEWVSPNYFTKAMSIMKRAFIEGYLLAKTEQRREDLSYLVNCYSDEVRKETNEKDNSHNNIRSLPLPRCSVSSTGGDNLHT